MENTVSSCFFLQSVDCSIPSDGGDDDWQAGVETGTMEEGGCETTRGACVQDAESVATVTDSSGAGTYGR
jgi:hypothetical protein